MDDEEFYDDNEDILNSSLYSISTSAETSRYYNKEVHDNTSLKYGIVVDVYDIDHEKNSSGKAVEYKVLSVDQKPSETPEPKFYDNCISIDGFGGVADFFECKLRPVTGTIDGKKSEALIDINFENQYGNMVLILCLHGSTDKAIIVGNVSHGGRKTKLTKEAGVHLEGEYNGINWQINKDGELTVTFNSSTDDTGAPSDLEALGTSIKLDKTGSIHLDTDNETDIKLDKSSQDVTVNAGNNITAKASTDVTLDAGGKFSAKSTADFLMDAGSSAKFSAKSKINIEAKGETTIKGAKVIIDSKGSVDIKGKVIELDAPAIKIGKGGMPAVTPMTKFYGIGNLGIPIISNAVGPFSSTVLIKI